MTGAVVWFEVLGQDADKLRGFYGELFGWKFKMAEGMDYGMLEQPEKGIPGGVGKTPQGPGWSTFYVKVDDVEATIKRATASGGRVLMPVTKLPDNMVIAVIADPEGHPVGLSSGM